MRKHSGHSTGLPMCFTYYQASIPPFSAFRFSFSTLYFFPLQLAFVLNFSPVLYIKLIYRYNKIIIDKRLTFAFSRCSLAIASSFSFSCFHSSDAFYSASICSASSFATAFISSIATNACSFSSSVSASHT